MVGFTPFQRLRSPLGNLWSILPALILALLTAGTVWAAINWPSQETVNVSQSGEVSQVALAVGTEKRAVAWWVNADSDRKGDLILAQSSGNGWITTTVTNTLQSRGPSLAYSGTTLFLAWVHGETYMTPTAFGGRIWEWDDQGGMRLVSETIFYGDEHWIRPRLRVGEDGLHLAFAAALTSTGGFPQIHLFYAYRPFESNLWSMTVAITSAQVGEGKVFYPDLAIGNGQIHLVWEQRSQISSISSTVYYVSGTMGTEGPLWAAPVRLSSGGASSQLPGIAVDEQGRVHVAWTLYYEDQQQVLQQVLYRRLEPTGWTSAQPLSGDEPLSVNRLRPTVVWPAIAAQGDIVCVAWHGFYPGATQEKEEIYLRCSKDGGATWGPVMNVSQSPDKLSLFPAIAIGADGVIHLAWEEFQGGSDYLLNYDAMYAQGPSEVWQVFLPLVLRSW
ncbi:MAG: hypothetical protein ACUVXE_09175 [Anaerolineae bacterium]